MSLIDVVALNLIVFRTGLSVKELLDRADAIKRIQHHADVEELKLAAEKMKQHGRFSSTVVEDTRKSSKAKTKQPIIEHKRKDAPPYRVSV